MLDLARDTIFVTLAGSQAHGTAREGSDVDLRGVCIAPMNVRLSLFHEFEQFEGGLEGDLWAKIEPLLQRHAAASRAIGLKTEAVIFDIAKFLRLCAAANPNALEVLFADEADWLCETPVWRRLHRERQRFLSRKVQQTYLGYAMAQLRKIRTHRAWLLEPPARKPTRMDFGLPPAATVGRDDQNRIEQSIAEKMRSYGIDAVEMSKAARIAVEERLRTFWEDALSASEEELDERVRAVATYALQLPPETVAALNAERKYRGALKHWEAYQAWKAERNPVRAELERRHGYDTKHAMHLLRLMRTGLELLQAGELRVRRADAAELNAIRDGALSFDALRLVATELEEKMQEAAKQTSLPADVDHAFVDDLAFELISAGRKHGGGI
jgi:predicted nucleotidyltransferase